MPVESFDALDRFGDLVLRFDAEGRFLSANAPAAELLGSRVTPGTEWGALLTAISPATPDRIQAGAMDALVAHGQWRGQVKLADAAGHGELYDAMLLRAASPGGGNGDTNYLVIFRSLAETRRRESVERELAARDEFVARLGHELRTPLNAVLGFAQLLELEELEGDQRDGVERILTAGRHMQALLDDVLDLAKVRSGGVDLDVGPVSVIDVVRGVVDLMQPLADKRGIRRYIDPADDAVAMLDRRRLWQVLLNLIGNAVKYGRENGTVRVGVRIVGDRLHIEVADDGPGIDREQLDRMFRPFERLGAERTGIEGTGLGLALSRALTAAMGGSLSATSKLGVGTTFTVSLEAVSAGVVAELSRDAGDELRRDVVLYVGADPGGQALVTQALKTRLGVEVVCVDRGALALDAIHRHQPAVIVAEADLPDVVGNELLHRLGSDPLSALVPKIVLSEDSDPRVHLRLRAAGAQQIVLLPLNVREFVDTVGDLLRRQTSAAAPPTAPVMPSGPS